MAGNKTSGLYKLTPLGGKLRFIQFASLLFESMIHWLLLLCKIVQTDLPPLTSSVSLFYFSLQKKSIVRFSPCLSILALQLPTTLPSCRITGLKIPKLLCALAVCFFSSATQLICSSPLHFTRTKVQIY